jgi:hypothetical protein
VQEHWHQTPLLLLLLLVPAEVCQQHGQAGC